MIGRLRAPSPRTVRRVAWIAGVVVAAAEAYAGRHHLNPDGLQYLDMGQAWFEADWETALNGYWSPLYAVVIGAALELSGTWGTHEVVVAHAVNFAIFLAAFAAFELFLDEFLQAVRRDDGTTPGGERIVNALAYLLFLWVSLGLINLARVNPDLLLSALVWLAAGLLLRTARRGGSGAAALLGASLGAAFLTKSIMLPVGVVILASLAPVAPSGARVRTAALSLAGFLLVVAPFIAFLSAEKGRLTFMDTGKIAYARMVGGIDHWEAERRVEPGEMGEREPRQGVRLLSGPGTYPLKYDPSRSFESVEASFHPTRQLRRLVKNLAIYSALASPLAAALLILLAGASRGVVRRPPRLWYLVVPSAVALGLYALVYVTPRYVGPFLTLAFLALYAHLAGDRGVREKMLAGPVAAGTAAILLLQTTGLVIGFMAAVRSVEPDRLMAADLREMGAERGDRVALVGDALWPPYWARLAGMKIVGEVAPEQTPSFWISESYRRDAIEAFRRAGASFVVVDSVPASWGAAGQRWIPVGDAGHAARSLRESGP